VHLIVHALEYYIGDNALELTLRRRSQDDILGSYDDIDRHILAEVLGMRVFAIVTLLFVFYYGFTSSDGTFTFSNITAIFEKIHIQALGLSLLLAVITTAVCLLFAYPLALILSKSAAKNRSFVIFIFILPMWINFLLRIIAIRMLLSDNGILGISSRR